MAPLPILVTGASSLVAAACFLLVGVALRRRRYSAELRHAGQAYVLWWFTFAFVAMDDAARILLGLADPPPADLYGFLAELKIAANGVAIWALGRYVLFLRNGRGWYSLPIAVFAIVHSLFFVWGVEAGRPAEIAVDTWSPRLVLHGPGTGLPGAGPLTLIMYFLPTILLCLAYLVLARRMETRTQRARVVAIALGVVVFQVVQTIQFNLQTPADSPLFAILPLVSAAMALVVLATYRPPAWLTRRFGIEGLARDADPAANGNGALVR